MANVIEINWKPDDRTLRHFGFIALAGFGFVAALAWTESLIFAFGLGDAREPVAFGFAAIAGISAALSLVYPRANLAIYLAITVLTYPIGFVLSYVLMGTLFYLIIAPIGVAMRLFGKDPLERRVLPQAETYWVDSPASQPSERYFKQF